MSNSDMAEKIRQLRINQGMTLEEVAQKVGVGRSTVRKWETGMIANMRRDKILVLAQALNTSPEYLMGWELNSKHGQDALDGLGPLSDEDLSFIKKYSLSSKEDKEFIRYLFSATEEEQEMFYNIIKAVKKERK